jgi:rhodanese-related sulfurtransferase
LPGGEPPSVSTLPVVPTREPGWLPQTDAEVPRVSLPDALAALESGEAVIVDVRSPDSYEASHIAGAISIPLEVIQTDPNALSLDKDQWIITYCT